MNKTEIQLIPMSIDDYEEIHSLWMKIKGFGIRQIDYTKEEIAKFIDRNPTTSVVAKDGNRIVGTILCGSDGRQGYLYHVCVEKEYRRKGIGSSMVDYCLTRLRAIGTNKVTLIAFSGNDIGNAFWKQTGWKKMQANYYEFSLNEKNITMFIES